MKKLISSVISLFLFTLIAAETPDLSPGPEAKTTASGLSHQLLQPGTGTIQPKATDMVLVHYVGWTADGKKFDDSIARGQPVTFPLDRVIPGWTEGLQLMKEGETRRFWVPTKLAYGEKPILGAHF